MSKDYNIDDILSEVKKRREENENEIKEAAETETAVPEEETVPVEEAPAEEAPETEEPPEAEEAPETEEEMKSPDADAETEDGEMVNLLELADEEEAAETADIYEEEEKPEKVKKEKTKTQKVITAIIAVLIALVLIAGGFFAWQAFDWLKILDRNNDDISNASQAEWQGMKHLVENFDPIIETDASELSSLEDMVRTWYYNGSPCSSTHVLNVLLVGEDTRGKEILEDDTRADAAIIASINIDTKEIVLTSVLRDSWSYWETTPGDESTGKFGKLNGAMSTGNLNVYINSLEKLYKIDIDNYAIVNFTSFEKIIDKLYKNGIELELTDAEIYEINNHQGRYGGVTIEKTFEGSKGKMRLNGKQALAYCRIRHIDTDNARADRQKTTLMTIFNDFKDAPMTKQLQLIDKLVPYVKTGFSTNEIVKIASYGFSHGWTKFDVSSFNYPTVNVTGGIYGSEFFNQWIWRADFPADAYDMQMRIYGKSSITLAQRRVDTKRVNRTGFYRDGARPTDYYYTNPAYGEPTTLAKSEDEEEEEEQ